MNPDKSRTFLTTPARDLFAMDEINLGGLLKGLMGGGGIGGLLGGLMGGGGRRGGGGMPFGGLWGVMEGAYVTACGILGRLIILLILLEYLNHLRVQVQLQRMGLQRLQKLQKPQKLRKLQKPQLLQRPPILSQMFKLKSSILLRVQ
jgi:hypothetical protein